MSVHLRSKDKYRFAFERRVAMQNFFMMLTLSSLTGPQVVFITHPQFWENKSACVSALPKMESAVTRLIGYDAAVLDLLGATAGGVPKIGYFVSASACHLAEPNP